jgi:energy-coupling factor transport system permease protein
MLLGQYRPLDSFLHRLDVRSKLVPVLLVMVLGLLTESLLFYIISLVALLGGLAFSGVGAAAIGRSFRPIMILVAITFVYHIIFTGQDGEPLVELCGFSVTELNLSRAAFFSTRLLLFVSVVFLVTLTSSPSELAEAIARMLRPLEKIGVPAGDLGLVLFIAMRFIPILTGEFQTIRDAQIIRGVDFAGSLVNRIKRTATVIIPVLIAAISRADELALAMEARGYRSGRRRTFYTHSHFDGYAWTFAVGSSLLLGLAFYLTGSGGW